jgi:hypothetical protein
LVGRHATGGLIDDPVELEVVMLLTDPCASFAHGDMAALLSGEADALFVQILVEYEA